MLVGNPKLSPSLLLVHHGIRQHTSSKPVSGQHHNWQTRPTIIGRLCRGLLFLRINSQFMRRPVFANRVNFEASVTRVQGFLLDFAAFEDATCTTSASVTAIALRL
jgi:hypothetical protein